MKVLAWNVRGLGSPSKRSIVKEVIYDICPDIVILSETRLSSINQYVVKSLWSSISIAWASLDAIDTAEGIIIMWDALNLHVINAISGYFSVSINIKHDDNYSWWCSGIYGPVNRHKKSAFWQELYDLNGLCFPSWLIGGDFNVYRWSHETNSSNPPQRSMKNFNRFIENSTLLDPTMSNGLFTWSNGNGNGRAAMSRIDRFLFTNDWQVKFNEHQSRRLPRVTSDHFPILLESSSLKWGPCPFRFENRWLGNKHFIRNIESWWEDSQTSGFPGYAFIKSLKSLANKCKSWNKLHQKQHQTQLIEITKEITNIDNLEEAGHLTDIDVAKRTALKSDLNDLAINETRK